MRKVGAVKMSREYRNKMPDLTGLTPTAAEEVSDWLDGWIEWLNLWHEALFNNPGDDEHACAQRENDQLRQRKSLLKLREENIVLRRDIEELEARAAQRGEK